jgi:secreted trypsin-like serine protease
VEGHVKKLVSAAVLVLAVGALAASPAGAITYGTPDTTNKYPYVGALVGTFDGETYPYCSGTLISPTVFLTAAHCEEGERVCVTFDAQYTSRSKLHCGTWYAHPGYYGGESNPLDVAVIVFDRPVKGITPAQVVDEGLLDAMKADGTLTQSTAFTSVGYGAQETSPPHGGPGGSFTYLDRREYSVGYFNALGPGYLRISQNPNAGSAGTCYGVSGGPIFLGDTNVVVSLTVTGDVFCKSTNVTQRLDIPEVQDFLAQFIAL